MSETLHFVEIDNPFEQSIKERKEVPYVKDQTVLGYLPGPISSGFVASVNGELLMDDELARRIPEPGDFIVLCPRVQGGGDDDDKMILRIVVMIVIIVASQGAGASMAASFGGSASAWSAGIAIAANMAANAIMNSATNRSRSMADSSASYGADGAKLTSDEGIPVPVIYGNFRSGGNIIGNYVRNDADDNQVLFMLINLGEGPVGSPSDWLLNEQKAADVGAEVTFYDGSDADNLIEKIRYFNEAITPFNQNYRLTTDWYTYTTEGEVDRLRLDFVAPAGLYQTDSDGDERSVQVEVEVQYRKVGTTTWVDLPTEQKFDTLIPKDTWLNILHEVGQTPVGDGDMEPIYEEVPYAVEGDEVLSTWRGDRNVGGDGGGSQGPGGDGWDGGFDGLDGSGNDGTDGDGAGGWGGDGGGDGGDGGGDGGD